jgi:hypothetical protein
MTVTTTWRRRGNIDNCKRRHRGHRIYGSWCFQRAIGDNAGRAGTRPQAILDTLRNPTKITEGVDDRFRPYKIYTGNALESL